MQMKRIKKVLAWLPVIWKDEDWGEHFMVRLLQFKLKRMAKALENGHTQSGPYDAHKIRVVCAHFDRYLDIWKFHKVEFLCPHDLFSKPDCDCPRWISRRDFQMCKRQREIEDWHWSEAWRKISRYGQGWWD